MHTTLEKFGSEFTRATEKETLLAYSEGLVKVRAMEVALSLGWILQEGAGSTPAGPVADYLAIKDGDLVWNRAPRLVALPAGSADFTVIAPSTFMLEIKARPDFGTKCGAQFDEMWADVARIAAADRIAFLFVFDEKIYRSFSGEKTERRVARPTARLRGSTLTFRRVVT